MKKTFLLFVATSIFSMSTLAMDDDTLWRVKDPTAPKKELKSIKFVDGQNGWAVGAGGTVLHSLDGGKTWMEVQNVSTENLESVYFIDNNTGWIVGENGTILSTVNGGDNWISQPSGVSHNLRSVHFFDDKNGWAAGESGTVLHTTDGGESWQQQNTGLLSIIEDIQFIDANKGWLVSDNGVIMATNNAGDFWNAQQSVSSALYDVFFIDALNGWAVGNDATILRTENGGANWHLQLKGSGSFTSVYFINKYQGWVVGEGGKIYKTVTGGSSFVNPNFPATPAGWNLEATNIGVKLSDVFFTSNTIGWAVGADGTIVEYTNAAVSVNKILASDISIYPNPTQGQLSVSTTNNIETIEVYSQTGQLVKVVPVGYKRNLATFELDLNAGLYFIRVIDESGAEYTERISIQ